MKKFDHLLQALRIAQAKPHIPKGARVLDVGCHNGSLLKFLGDQISYGMGIDPDPPALLEISKDKIWVGEFPEHVPSGEYFDVIAMLAVWEHVPAHDQNKMAEACSKFLVDGGRVVLTVPSPWVDKILPVLQWLGIAETIKADQHIGVTSQHVKNILLAAGFILLAHHTFEFGLNHLFVFQKPASRRST